MNVKQYFEGGFDGALMAADEVLNDGAYINHKQAEVLLSLHRQFGVFATPVVWFLLLWYTDWQGAQWKLMMSEGQLILMDLQNWRAALETSVLVPDEVHDRFYIYQRLMPAPHSAIRFDTRSNSAMVIGDGTSEIVIDCDPNTGHFTSLAKHRGKEWKGQYDSEVSGDQPVVTQPKSVVLQNSRAQRLIPSEGVPVSNQFVADAIVAFLNEHYAQMQIGVTFSNTAQSSSIFIFNASSDHGFDVVLCIESEYIDPKSMIATLFFNPWRLKVSTSELAYCIPTAYVGDQIIFTVGEDVYVVQPVARSGNLVINKVETIYETLD